MVRLSAIYTKTGDDGTTGLGDGSRVHKDDLRVSTYGTVDEANSVIGLCRLHAICPAQPRGEAIDKLLSLVQNDLFDVGADLCCPLAPDEIAAATGKRLRMSPSQTQRLERAIDEHNAHLKPLDSFVLPGGSALAAHLHVARTVVRRAERGVASLLRDQPGQTNPEALLYLNRLSDLLFVLARIANGDGARDVKWVPGAGR